MEYNPMVGYNESELDYLLNFNTVLLYLNRTFSETF